MDARPCRRRGLLHVASTFAALVIALGAAHGLAGADTPAESVSPASAPARWEWNNEFMLMFGRTSKTHQGLSGPVEVGKGTWQLTLDRHLPTRPWVFGGGAFAAGSSGGWELGAVARLRRPMGHHLVAWSELGPTLALDDGGSTAFAATARVGLELYRLGVFVETRLPFLELADTPAGGVDSQSRREILFGVQGRGVVGFAAAATSVVVVMVLGSVISNATGGSN